MTSESVEITRWGRVRWDCSDKDCDGHVYPVDSVDYDHHEELWEDTSQGVADKTNVACGKCGTVYDVSFTPVD